MQIAYCTDKGLVREQNEDSFYAKEALLIVADGMGGHRAGEVASRIAIESVTGDLLALREESPMLGEIDRAIQYANHRVREAAAREEELTGMGTTLTLCYVLGHIAVIGHVGDSRAYMLRNGQLSRLTRDHSLVEELVRSGSITPEEALHHPHRHVITRALGSEGRVRADIKRIGVEPGDTFLLCTDGLIIHADDEEIARVLTDGCTLQEQAEELLRLALKRGGEDNITIVLARAEGGVQE